MTLVLGSTPVPFDDQYLRFLAAEEAATDRLRAFYAQTREELRAFLLDPPVPLTASEQAFYGALQTEVNRLADNADQVASSWLTDSIPKSFVEGALQHSPSIVFNVVHDDAVKALSGYTLNLITQMNDGMRRIIQQQIGVGLLEGATREVVSQRLLSSGLSNIPHWRSVEERAAAIARTEMMRAYNAGNLAGILDTGAGVVEWLTGEDERVCPLCGPFDRRRFRLSGTESDDPDVRKLDVLLPPPYHVRCRCTIRADYDFGGQATTPTPAPGGVIEQTPTPDGMPILSPAEQFEQKLDDLRMQFATDVGYWRDLTLDEGKIAKIAGRLDDPDAMSHFLSSRYGVEVRKMAGPSWESWVAEGDLREITIRAIERYRIAGLERNIVDSHYFRWFTFEDRVGANVLADCGFDGEIRFAFSKLKSYMRPGSLRGGEEVIGAEEIIVHELAHALHNRFGMIISERPIVFGTKAAELGGGYYGVDDAITALWKEWKAVRRKTKAGVWNAKTGVGDLELRLAELKARARAYERMVEEWDSLPLTGYETEQVVYEGSGMTTRHVVQKFIEYDSPEFGGKTVRISALDRDFVKTYLLPTERTNVAAYEKKIASMKGAAEHYPTEYAKKNMHEDFAESAMLYLLNPTRLKQSSPLRYAFMRDRIFTT